MTYTETYRQLVFSLFGHEPSLNEGLRSKAIEDTEIRLDLKLPQALKDYYLTLGNFETLNNAHNHLLRPEELYFEGEMLVFMEESQGICLWGIPSVDLLEDDPEVMQGLPGSTDWYPEDLTISEFFYLSIYLQTAWGAFPYYGEHPEADEVISAISGKWEKVADHNGLHIWKKNGMLISYLDDDSFCSGAARDEDAYHFLETALGFSPPTPTGDDS